MPGVATAQLLSYATIVDVDMDQTNDVNLADTEDYGHRVVVEMDVDAIKGYLNWYRAIGGARPLAKLNTVGENAFKTALEAALSDNYVDIDGVTGGLHFSSAVLSTNPDPRIREYDAVSANDIPFAYVIDKLYGSSAAATLDKIYNLGDAHGMLASSTLADAIIASLKANESGSVDKMFRDLLAIDPHRFFDATGMPMPGIFETRSDIYGSGNWKTTANDVIEIKLKFMFQSKVTRRGVAGREQNLGSSNPNEQVIINPGDFFYLRLQLKAKASSGAPVRVFTNVFPDMMPGGGSLAEAMAGSQKQHFRYAFVPTASTADVYFKTETGSKYDYIMRIFRDGYSGSLLSTSNFNNYVEIVSNMSTAYELLFFSTDHTVDPVAYENMTNTPNFRLKNLVPGATYIIWTCTDPSSSNDAGADASLYMEAAGERIELLYSGAVPNDADVDNAQLDLPDVNTAGNEGSALTVSISSITNPSNNGSTEFTMLASATFPFTIGDGAVYSYGPEYNTSAYVVSYDNTIDEIWLLDSGFPTVKFQKVGSSYVAYFDQYGRTDIIGQLRFN